MADVQHVDIQSADCHEPKHITDAVVADTGKVITPSSTLEGESELRFLTYTDLAAGLAFANRLTFADGANTTKRVTFTLSGIAAATTRTWAFPNTSDTFVGTTSTQTLTNKTLTLPVIASISNGGTVTIPPGAGTLVTLAATQTLTAKTLTSPAVNTPTITGGTANTLRVNPRVVGLTDAATIASSADTTDLGTVTLAGNRTLGAPTGTPVDGQVLRYRIRQDAVAGRTLAYNAVFRFTAGAAPTVTATANATTYLTFIYHAADVRWDCISTALALQA